MSGLYIHIPFCASKCPYCAFFSKVTDGALFDPYLSACLSEIALFTEKEFDTVYIGGGTPSVLGGERLGGFIRRFLKLINFTGEEFTVEVNPESANKAGFILALKDLPLTRISIGAQSLDSGVLKLLGRLHSPEDVLSLTDSIRKELNAAVGADIIYDIPGVKTEIIKSALENITALSPEHISAYSYSPDTGYLTDAATEDPAEFLAVAEFLESRGYLHYEVSNYAKPGFASKHNIKYWTEQEYIGIGAGAHSMTEENGKVCRYSHPPDIESYIKDPIARYNNELLDDMTVLKEALVFGLRLSEGADLLDITARYGKLPQEIDEKLKFLEKKGMLECRDGHIAATKKGFLLLDSVMSYLW
jgi:oxygen-independent coproporphyrinogen-3 oxidase